MWAIRVVRWKIGGAYGLLYFPASHEGVWQNIPNGTVAVVALFPSRALLVARKSARRWIGNQYLDQLENEVRSAIMGRRVSHHFRVGAEDGQVLAKELSRVRS